MILKNGKLYSIEQDDYCWKVVYEKTDAVLVFKFRKSDFSDESALVNFVQTSANF